MAEWSKALRSGRSGFESRWLLWLTKYFRKYMVYRQHGWVRMWLFWITRLKYDTLFAKINMSY